MTGSCESFPLHWEQIEAWVEAHRDDLPTNLAELSRYPMAFRRVIVNSVPREIRAAWWGEHLQAILSTEEELSAEQRVCIQEHILALPGIFGVGIGEKPAQDGGTDDRMTTLFTPELQGRIFQTLGPPEPPGGLPLPPDALQFV